MIERFKNFEKYRNFNEEADLFTNQFYDKMKEGLIHSVDYDFFCEKLEDSLKNYDVDYEITQKEKFVMLQINLKDINHKIIDKKLHELNSNMGYFTSNLIDVKLDDKIKSILISKNKEFIFYFQKRFDVPKGTPNMLYHSTTEQYYEKIKRTGLTTKSQNMVSDDLDRLYLTDNLAEALDFCTQKRFFIKKKYKDTGLFNMNIDKWIVLEIDISSIPDIKLYKDPKMENSYYTYDFIPFYSIRIKQRVNF